MIWLVLLMCLSICSTIALTVFFFSNCIKEKHERNKNVTTSSVATYTVEAIQAASTSDCVEAEQDVDSTTDAMMSYVEAPRTYRNNEYKHYDYLRRQKQLGNIRANIFARELTDLLSLELSYTERGDIAYVKSDDKFYIRTCSDVWTEYNEFNDYNLLEALDYSLIESTENVETE